MAIDEVGLDESLVVPRIVGSDQRFKSHLLRQSNLTDAEIDVTGEGRDLCTLVPGDKQRLRSALIESE